MNRLPDVMAALGPFLNSVGDGKKDPSDGADPGGEGEEMSGESRAEEAESGSLPAVIGKKPFRKTDAERLFLALKPYLGERRQNMVDRCVSVMQMSNLLKAAGVAGNERREP